MIPAGWGFRFEGLRVEEVGGAKNVDEERGLEEIQHTRVSSIKY
jgi:hypothetical protein